MIYRRTKLHLSVRFYLSRFSLNHSIGYPFCQPVVKICVLSSVLFEIQRSRRQSCTCQRKEHEPKRRACVAGLRNLRFWDLHRRQLMPADLAFLVLIARFRFSSVLINHPFKGVSCRIGLFMARSALMPMLGVARLPPVPIAMVSLRKLRRSLYLSFGILIGKQLIADAAAPVRFMTCLCAGSRLCIRFG